MREDTLEKTARALQLEAELRRLGTALRERGIEWVSMKGPILARRLAVDLHRRGWLVDNDVLVRQCDAAPAVEVLRGLGYAPPRFVKLESQLKTSFEAALFREDCGTTLGAEVHWAPFPWPLYPIDEHLVWSHTEVIEVDGWKVRVFDPALTTLHLASHFVQHLASEPRILNDIAWAWNHWQQELDSAAFRQLAKAFRIEHAVAYSLNIAADRGLLDTPAPFDTWRARWIARLVSAGDVGAERPRHDYWRMLQMAIAAPPERVPRWLWGNVFPPIDTLASVYDRPVTPQLYLRYFTRLFRPLGRRMGWVE